MRKFALATAAAVALMFSAPAFTAPALAQDGSVTVKIKNDGDRSVTRKKVVIRHGGDVERRRVVIRHGDRGRHLRLAPSRCRQQDRRHQAQRRRQPHGDQEEDLIN